MGKLRLITANLFNAHVTEEAVRELLIEAEPDVMTVQELAPRPAAVIAEHLPQGILDPRLNYEGRGIALRHPGRVARLSTGDRASWVATLEPADWPMLAAPLEIVCLHLVNPIDPPPWRSVRTRTAQLDGLERHIADNPGVNRVVAGDMNATPLWPAYRRLARMMEDGIAAAGTQRRTWGPVWWSPRFLRIDHVFVQGVRVVSSTTRRVRGSDHSAVIADLEV